MASLGAENKGFVGITDEYGRNPANGYRKTDKDDALKLAQMSAMSQLPTVELPDARVRPWRSLIDYRGTLVGRRTAIKNSLRTIPDRQGLSMLSGKTGWT